MSIGVMTFDDRKVPTPQSAGAVDTYLHPGGKIGVLLELGCESEFIARTEDFRELMHDIAMQIAASDPKFIRRQDITPEAYERQKSVYASEAAATGKPPHVLEQIVKGKMNRFYEEVCLDEQPFIKDPAITIAQLIAAKANKLGENIAVRRFARFKAGENSAPAVSQGEGDPEGGDETGVAVKRPKPPKSGSGFAAANFDQESQG